MRAAENATKSVDAAAVKAALEKVNLSENRRKAIGEAADKAESAFNALNAFTGRELGDAVKAENGVFEWDNAKTASEAINKAIDAQAELADMLRKAINETHNKETAALLDEAVMQCDRRASEIQTLVCEFADIVEKGDNTAPEVKARLDSTLGKLLPRKALEMHGNDAAIVAMKTQLEPLAKRLDKISKNPGTSLSKKEINAIKREVGQMENALQRAVKNGSANGVFVDRTLLGAAKDVLGDVLNKIANASKEISKASMLNFAGKAFSLSNFPILSDKFAPFLKAVAPNLVTFVEKRKRLHKAAREYAEKPNMDNLLKVKQQLDECGLANRKKLDEELVKLNDKLIELFKYPVGGPEMPLLDDASIKEKILSDAEKLGPEIREACKEPLLSEFVPYIKEFLEDTKNPNLKPEEWLSARLIKEFSNPKGLLTQVSHLEMMAKTAERMDNSRFLTSDTVLSAFEGNLRFTTLVESRLHGFEDADIDPSLDDINVESSKTLGSGKANTVYEVSYKNGTTYVFKPEVEGRKGVVELELAKNMANNQMVAQLNMASQKTADLLGLDDVMTKTTVGTHKGSFGIFMEKAPGMEVQLWRKDGERRKFNEDELSPSDIKKLPDEQYAKIVGDIIRKSNRLDWFDMITGQGDRHGANYLLAVKKEDKQVTLKAIDNDACFPAYRTNIRTFTLDANKSDAFKKALEDLAKRLYSGCSRRDKDDFLQALLEDKGITEKKDGTLIVDTTAAESPLIAVALTKVLGMHTTALPDYIDEDLYNRLIAMEKSGTPRDKFIADMKAHLPKDAVTSAIARLDGAIKHAKELQRKGNVISANDWYSQNVQRKVAGKLPGQHDDFRKIPKPNDIFPDFVEKEEKLIARDYEFSSSGYFHRDLMLSLAKPGWFDEDPNVNVNANKA